MRVIFTVSSFGLVSAMSGNVWVNSCVSGEYAGKQTFYGEMAQDIGYTRSPTKNASYTIFDIQDLPVPEHLKEEWGNDRNSNVC